MTWSELADTDPGKRFTSVEDVIEIKESSNRWPPELANIERMNQPAT